MVRVQRADAVSVAFLAIYTRCGCVHCRCSTKGQTAPNLQSLKHQSPPHQAPAQISGSAVDLLLVHARAPHQIRGRPGPVIFKGRASNCSGLGFRVWGLGLLGFRVPRFLRCRCQKVYGRGLGGRKPQASTPTRLGYRTAPLCERSLISILI